MANSNFPEEEESSKHEIAEAVRLIRKVIRHRFGEVVIKVQNGKIVVLEERLTHRPMEGTGNSGPKF